MQIIVVGCGKVGSTLAAQLSEEDNNVTVIDTNPEVVRDISETYDVMGIEGNGTSYRTLQQADLEHTDLLIAVTESDEVNLLCCVVAKRQADVRTIARVRNPIYSTESAFLRKELQLSMTINPELEAAREISRLLRFPNAIEIDSFSKEKIDLLRFKLPENSLMAGVPMHEFSRQIEENVLVCIAERGNEIFIPKGNFVPQAGDVLTVITEPAQTEKFFRKIGIRTNRVRNVLIVGGGGITFYLTEILLKMGIDVKIIEKNTKRCEELSDLFPAAVVDFGDGSSQDVLAEERLEDMDAFVACTGIDEVNAIISLYAQTKVHTKVVTKMNHIEFGDVIKSLHLDSTINPRSLTAQKILQYVRAMSNSMDSNMETLYRLLDDRVEAMEFTIRAPSRVTGVKLADMQIKDNVLIAGIVRGGKLIICGGQDEFKVGDSVIVITTNLGFHDLLDILR